MDKGNIIRIFPNLKDDKFFKISSPEDPNYNCIAWAFHLFQNRWMEPPAGTYIPELDAVTWWPEGATEGTDISCLVEAFQKNSFQLCDSWEHESGYIKVALYHNPTNNCWTHASRESRSGKYWLSKLGQSNDIHHGTPFSIEGAFYGKVYCFLKREDN